MTEKYTLQNTYVPWQEKKPMFLRQNLTKYKTKNNNYNLVQRYTISYRITGYV